MMWNSAYVGSNCDCGGRGTQHPAELCTIFFLFRPSMYELCVVLSFLEPHLSFGFRIIIQYNGGFLRLCLRSVMVKVTNSDKS